MNKRAMHPGYATIFGSSMNQNKTDMKHRILLLLLISCISAETVLAKECPMCPKKHAKGPFILDSLSARDYEKNFRQEYWTSERRRTRNTAAMSFSRKAFEEFYDSNFVRNRNYTGMNVYPVVYGGPLRVGQVDQGQFGLVLAPRTSECKAPIDGFIVGNNSFDSTVSSPDIPPIQYIGKEVEQFRKQFKKQFKHGIFKWDRLYSRAMFLDKRVCDFIASYFKATSKADGIAIYPATYNRVDEYVCGQKRGRQMTFVIVAIVDGKPDFGALANYFRDGNAFDKGFLAANHGSLCPSKCY